MDDQRIDDIQGAFSMIRVHYQSISISGGLQAERAKNEFMKLSNRLIRIIAIIAFIFITLALAIIAGTPTATGYELTIYDGYPFYFWFFIIASNSCGIGILIHNAFVKEKSNWWLAGLCIVIFSNSILLGLPFFHGYGFYPKGDALTHIGMMKDIMATGHIGSSNFYPSVHILGVSLFNVTRLSSGAITNLFFVFWSIIYILSMYLLATMVANYREQALLITAFTSPLVFSYMHTLIHPSMLSLFMLPLLLYFYQRRQKISSGQMESNIVLMLLAFAITFTHPVTCLFAIILLLAFNLSSLLYQQVVNRKESALQNSPIVARNYNVPLIMFIAFFAWCSSYAAIEGSIRRVWDFLVYGSGMSLFKDQMGELAMAEITTSQAIELFIYRYGAIFIYGFISLIATGIVLRTSLSKRDQPSLISFIYAIQFIVALAVSVFSLFGFTGEYDPVRVSRFFLVVSPIVCGLVIYDFISRGQQQRVNLNRLKLKPREKAFISIITLLILTAGILSIFNVYGSPRTVDGNWQVSKMEITGTKWFSTYQDRNIITAVIPGGEFLTRFEDFNFGRETCPSTNKATLESKPVPSHFGYDENSSVAETFNFEERYLLTCEAGRISTMVIPENVRHKARQYTEEDFAKLRVDSTVTQIYTNGGFEIWRVYGK